MPETLILPDLDVMDAAALKAMVRTQHKQFQAQRDQIKAQHEQYLATLSSRASEIAHLKRLLDKLQRMLFGARSEKLVRQVAQLELQLEELETSRGEEEVSAHLPFQMATEEEPKQSSRRTLPEHLPREARAGQRKNQDRTALDLCARWPSMCRSCSARGLVRLLARPPRRASTSPSQDLPRNAPGRCLCGISSTLRRRQDRRSSLLGPYSPQVPRHPRRDRVTPRSRGRPPHR